MEVKFSDDVTCGIAGDETKERKMEESLDPGTTSSGIKLGVDDGQTDKEIQNNEEDEELEEGELKDDDDDDDDDDVDDDDGAAKQDAQKATLKDSSDEGNFDTEKHVVSKSSSASIASNGSNKPSTRVSEASGNVAKRFKPKTSSTRSSSPSTDHINRPMSFRSRHGSDSRHSSRSQSRSKRIHSSSNSNQQARLITMRAKLLEAKSREIEMKFQKNKSHLTTAPSISSTISLTSSRNLKTTVTKPSITYAENPNPVDLSPDPRKKAKSSKSSKSESKEKRKSSKKASKKRKKSSSSSKKKKRSKKSETPKKGEPSEPKAEVVASSEAAFDVVDHHGPKTPPDNQVLTLDDEQIEWPSYLIKMTTTQPSISYSVNPDSMPSNNPAEQPDLADLNADFTWYCNYLMNTYDMDKLQAQHQASSIIMSSDSYSVENLKHWLEQQGFSKQSDSRDEMQKRDTNGDSTRESANLPLRTNKPTFTILKSLKDITLPTGKVLPKGTIQKIVHPYPRQDRVIPDVTTSLSDFHSNNII